MWYYWLATTYIDMGFEALHVGRIDLLTDNDRDNDLQATRCLFKKIRDYAKCHARRHLVLINGGRVSESVQGDELIFDFVKASAKTKEAPPYRRTRGGGNTILTNQESCGSQDYYCKCHPSNNQNNQNNCYEPGTCFDEIYGHAPSGTTPLGWSCDPCPYIVEIDTGNGTVSTKGNRFVTEGVNQDNIVVPMEEEANMFAAYRTYGTDELSWFDEQSCYPELAGYQEDWVQYAYYKVRCMDDAGYLELPGTRGTHPEPDVQSRFYASNSLYATYKEIWNGSIHPLKGAYHNFTDEVVMNNPIADNVSKNLVSLGNRMYYIGTDGTIEGYLLSPSLGGWNPTSPSWAAANNGYPVIRQTPAIDNLVTNRGGTRLYFQNNNNGISVLNMVGGNIWDWTYEEIPHDGYSGSLVADHLVAVGDDKVFYVGQDKRIYGYAFSGGGWQGISPTWGSSNPNSIPLALTGSFPPYFPKFGGMTANAEGTKLFYIDESRKISGFNLNPTSIWSYGYFQLPENNVNALSFLISTSNGGLYFIEEFNRISGYIRNNFGQYELTSPSVYANIAGHNMQTIPQGYLAASPDGKKLYYLGYDGLIHGLNINLVNNPQTNEIDPTHVSYFNIEAYPGSAFGGIRDLTVSYDGQLFFNSTADHNVHYYSFENDVCGILPIRVIETCGQTAGLQAPSDQIDVLEETLENDFENGEGALKISPNPTRSFCNISGYFEKGNTQIIIFDYMGKLKERKSFSLSTTMLRDINLDFSNYLPGIYFCVHLHDGMIKNQEKIVVF